MIVFVGSGFIPDRHLCCIQGMPCIYVVMDNSLINNEVCHLSC